MIPFYKKKHSLIILLIKIFFFIISKSAVPSFIFIQIWKHRVFLAPGKPRKIKSQWSSQIVHNVGNYSRKISSIEKRQNDTSVADAFHAWAKRFHRRCRSSFCDDSNCNFHVQKWDADEEEHYEIREKKNCSARFVKQIRKAPDVSKADAVANAGEEKVFARFPSFPICHVSIMLTRCWPWVFITTRR